MPTHTCMCTRAHTCMYKHICAHAYTRVYAHTYMHVHTCMRAHTHEHTCTLRLTTVQATPGQSRPWAEYPQHLARSPARSGAQQKPVGVSEAACSAARPPFRCPGRPRGPGSSGRLTWISPSSTLSQRVPPQGTSAPVPPPPSPLGLPRALVWPVRPSEIWPHHPSPELTLAPHAPLPPPHQGFSVFKTPPPSKYLPGPGQSSLILRLPGGITS